MLISKLPPINNPAIYKLFICHIYICHISNIKLKISKNIIDKYDTCNKRYSYDLI